MELPGGSLQMDALFLGLTPAAAEHPGGTVRSVRTAVAGTEPLGEPPALRSASFRVPSFASNSCSSFLGAAAPNPLPLALIPTPALPA